MGIFPLGVKRQGREVEDSPPSSAEVKNGGIIPPLLPRPSWHGAQLIRHRKKFKFYLLPLLSLSPIISGARRVNRRDFFLSIPPYIIMLLRYLTVYRVIVGTASIHD
jgi:hypothetical protein